MTDPPLSILYVTLQARRPGEAGHTHVTEIVGALRARGHTVTLLEPHYQSLAPSLPRRLRTIFGVIREARRRIRRGGIDVVYVRGHLFSYWITVWARRVGLPVVLERNAPLTETYLIRPWLRPFHGALRWLGRRELRTTSAVVGVTEEVVAEARALSAPREVPAHVIPNGANVDVMRPVLNPDLDAYGLDPGRYVAFVGAMARWQGIPELLEAVRSPRWPEDVQVAFCGHGPLLPDVLALASEGAVKYLGVIPYEQVPVVVSGAIAGLAPVDQPPERAIGSSALKVYEYLSCGRPAVVTEVPGLREIIRDGGCGRVVPVRDPEAIAEAVRWLREHPDEAEAMGRRGRELVVERHSWAIRAGDVEEVLAGTLTRVRGGA